MKYQPNWKSRYFLWLNKHQISEHEVRVKNITQQNIYIVLYENIKCTDI